MVKKAKQTLSEFIMEKQGKLNKRIKRINNERIDKFWVHFEQVTYHMEVTDEDDEYIKKF